MKLSTKGQYGVRAMYDLAHLYGGAPQSVKCIAERQGIAATECVVSECERANGCAMHALWLRIHRGVNEVMDSISLQDMLEDAARCCQEAESEVSKVSEV